MAETSGFFNALITENIPDRKYNANDYSDNLAVVIANGVLYEENGERLRPTLNGLIPTITAGRAWINGHWYKNDTPLTLPAITPPAGGKRIDRIVLRLDNEVSGRDIHIVYLQGEAAAEPAYPAITRTNTIYDLCLADIFINAGASTATLHDARGDDSVCGWALSIRQVKEELILFQEGIEAVKEAYKYTFTCRGTDDNFALSEIAKALYGEMNYTDMTNSYAKAFISTLGGQTYLNSLNNESQITVYVAGKFGAQRAYSGTGQADMRYKWLEIGSEENSKRKIIFDFSRCEKITIQAASAYNIIFFGTDLYLNNVNCYAYSNSNYHIQMIERSYRNNEGSVVLENCRLSVSTGGQALISTFGEFVNCFGVVKSTGNDAYCFFPDAGACVQVVGGTYLAYNAAESAAIFAISSGTNAGIIASSINCPKITESAPLKQKYFAKGYGGKTIVNGVRTTLLQDGANITVYGKVELD